MERARVREANDCAGKMARTRKANTATERIFLVLLIGKWRGSRTADDSELSCSPDNKARPAIYLRRIRGGNSRVKASGVRGLSCTVVWTTLYVLKKSKIAFFVTSRPTSLIDFVSGISFGQTSTQFCA